MKTLDLLYVYDWLGRNATDYVIIPWMIKELEKHSVNMEEVKTYFTEYLFSPDKFDIEEVQIMLSASLEDYVLDDSYDNSIPYLFKITTNVNDNLRYSKDGGETWIDIIIPYGIYNVWDLNEYFSDEVEEDDKNCIYFSENPRLGNVILYTEGASIQVDLTVSNSIGKALGFEPQLLTKKSITSEKIKYVDLSQFYVSPVNYKGKKFRKNSKPKMKLSPSVLCELKVWLEKNINNYTLVTKILDELEARSMELKYFKYEYTHYLLASDKKEKTELHKRIINIVNNLHKIDFEEDSEEDPEEDSEEDSEEY